MAKARWRPLAGAAGILTLAQGLAGCSFAPHYEPPKVALAPKFDGMGPWVPANPTQGMPSETWWTAYQDPQLDALEQRLLTDSPSLAAALARHDRARAMLREARADLFPQVGLGGTLTANRQSDQRPLRSNGSLQPDYYGAHTVSASGSYEADVWGRVRANISAGRADAQAAADDLADTRLQLQAELAEGYIVLRGQDREIELLTSTVAAYSRADHMTERRFAGGIANGMEIGQSGAQLAEAKAALAEARNARALAEHAVATLVGTPATGFSVPASARPLPMPEVPVSVPSTLLERRPDIAAAERRVAAANQRIGVAKAAFFPSLLLGGQIGTQTTSVANLFTAPTTFWSIGPNVAFTLLDGGRRHARVREARADWEAAAATYRGKVLSAVQDVEDGLSQLHHLGDEAMAETRAAQQAGQVETLATRRYERGAVSYLDVVNAQTTALRTRQQAIRVETRRLQASVRLFRAVGGGWSLRTPGKADANAAAMPATVPATKGAEPGKG